MASLFKKRVDFTVERAAMESAEKILANFGLSPDILMSMIYAEIARTGEIPVSSLGGLQALNAARLTAISHNLPSVNVTTKQEARNFLEDDGGY